jgi:hypothetical protein
MELLVTLFFGALFPAIAVPPATAISNATVAVTLA